ncbi:MAG: putative ATP synthase YscN [Deltaproteobacteria bacterium ADurb.BinA179]|jgi:flagellum-specific ATP synthase|nr:MAG: putative ATP synthase YscN [Deltaproteobacteria bacterium ADurb.BinA179]HOD70712.1 FliI/YscN family ATPase [Deltaproteobacteria bacterium]HOE73474.1 FliI/YscN family ATPase [Deltaproteobacteria bacterium]HOS27406.1 FliI/YscN family ATPase [Deltaproteobacteria bacterium]HPL87974.1 FliI/YscN family ATPase [Deltaproteobacteria bacterium]
MTDFAKHIASLKDTDPIQVRGKVTNIVGLVVEGHGPGSCMGGMCEIYSKGVSDSIMAEVVGFRDKRVLLMPLGDLGGIGPGSTIIARKSNPSVKVGDELLGRVIDGMGNPLDGKGSLTLGQEMPLYGRTINPLKKKRITEPLDLGIAAINGVLTIGKGQRMAIMAGSGVGKSVLMGMMARHTQADVNVIALIGERGREVKEFIERDLGPEGLKRSVVIAATSDQPALIRIRGAYLATTVAEYFRDKGLDVLLMMDSITRYALSMREIGLAVGEPPTTKGYTPSCFAKLPRLLERAGNTSSKGSITGLYTVLVEGDDFSEPVADSVRSIVDGHIVLSRELAARNHYPAIDILGSVSRVMNDIVSREHMKMARRIVEYKAVYEEARDLINIGAYVAGSNPQIDTAVKHIDAVNEFLRQDIDERVTLEESLARMGKIIPAVK